MKNKAIAGMSLATFLSLVAAMKLVFPTKEEVPTKQEMTKIEEKIDKSNERVNALTPILIVSCVNSAKNEYDRMACMMVSPKPLTESTK